MKCRVCRGEAVIDIRRHNANFCAEHFLAYFRRQVQRAIENHRMFAKEDRILVAVSGGKDSLALWDVLLDLGYDASGLYLGLGIGGYSERSRMSARRFAQSKGALLIEEEVEDRLGGTIPEAAEKSRRSPCGVCGLTKRHLMDRVAVDKGFDVLATGHNLDDEAAVLFGNVIRWEMEYIARQRPVLPEGGGFPRKVKPLFRLTERETAAWCVIRGIDYVVEECPMAAGNRHLRYKELLDTLEEMSPGSKAEFVLGFIDRLSPLLGGDSPARELGTCSSCGAPTSSEVCAFCSLGERVRGAGRH
ncbi:MAG: tRNA(Ile)-lysidine synthetase [Acidimicrobiales bacterium]|nr:MAG: tRNA(Ile)-lysidine synthetase [Acidimicrobiales bacterium]